MRHFSCGLLWLLVVLSGCAKEPFQREPLPLLDHPDPPALRAAFAHTVPARFTAEDTVIIEAPFHKLAALGMLRVHRDEGTYDLICLNPMGVQLFYLSGDRKQTQIHFAVPPLLERRETLLAIGEDIGRMYFEVLPDPAASPDVRPRSVQFRQALPEGTMCHVFGGTTPVLLEKRLEGWLGTIWRVSYYAYASTPDGSYPKGIVMDNYRFGYRIIVKNRSWQVE